MHPLESTTVLNNAFRTPKMIDSNNGFIGLERCRILIAFCSFTDRLIGSSHQ